MKSMMVNSEPDSYFSLSLLYTYTLFSFPLKLSELLITTSGCSKKPLLLHYKAKVRFLPEALLHVT